MFGRQGSKRSDPSAFQVEPTTQLLLSLYSRTLKRGWLIDERVNETNATQGFRFVASGAPGKWGWVVFLFFFPVGVVYFWEIVMRWVLVRETEGIHTDVLGLVQFS